MSNSCYRSVAFTVCIFTSCHLILLFMLSEMYTDGMKNLVSY